ncbi:MAG: GDP-mannose 4,6-dehydratase [Candidatus Hydrogenedens sp.]
MSKRALITGAGGFVGKHLTRHLINSGWEIIGCDIVPQEGVQTCNLLDTEQTETFIKSINSVSHVFHLSAVSFVPQSMQDPLSCFQTNTDSVISLTQLLNKHFGQDITFIFISTSEVYGPPYYLPINETHPLNPQNPYAISKLASDLYCQYIHKKGLLPTFIIRPFNHSGAGQNERFVLSSFAKQFIEMEKGIKQPILHVGNIEVKRDFLHVSDVVRVYELLAQKKGTGDVYNLCSGKTYSLKQIIDILQTITGIKTEILIDKERTRTNDIPIICGSYEKLKTDFSWEPQYDIKDILNDLLNYWRERIN